MGKNTNRKNISKGSKKTVKTVISSTDNKKVIWCFDMIDRDGKFAFNIDKDGFNHYEIMKKMIDYSNMTWAAVKQQTHDRGKSKHHFIGIDSLSKEAQNRFLVKHLEQYEDSIFSFALQNKLRIIGIRENEFFHVLWYDPDHEVCPSSLKNS